MTKTLKLSVFIVLGLAGAAVALVSYMQQRQSPTDTGLETMLGYVSADSPVVFAGQGLDVESGSSYYASLAHSAQDWQPLIELLRESSAGPGRELLAELLSDFKQTLADSGMQGAMARYGLDPEAAYLFYLDAAAPVVRLSLADPERFEQRLAEAEAKVGQTARREALGEYSLRVWPLAQSAEALQLGLLLDEHSLTLSLVSPKDSPDMRLARFARSPAERPLAGSELLKELRKRYARADLFMGYVDFHRLTQAVLSPEQSPAGRELRRWFPEQLDQLPQPSEACRREYTQLASQAPRLAMGMKEFSLKADELSETLGFDLAIVDEKTRESFRQLQGFVPPYSYRSEDKLGAFALGLNMSQLVPVLTDFWTRFTQASFDCETLKGLQQRARQTNPAMLAMGTAMVDSVRGLGFAVYDISLEDAAGGLPGGTVLFSLSATRPADLAALATNFVPQLAGSSPPSADGEPQPLPSFMGQSDLYWAIQGQHLVVYRGERAETAARSLADKSLDDPAHQGLTAGALNLREPMELLQLGEKALTRNWSDSGDCAALYAGILSATRMPMEASWREQFDITGWSARMDLSMTLPTLSESGLEGDYQLALLDGDSCQWQPLGEERLQAEGRGRYREQAQAADCTLYESDFNWQLRGGLLHQQPKSERERDTCEVDWQPVAEPVDFECRVYQPDDSGFYCLVQNEERFDVYRYRRRQ
mgnify:CR=1 FL=1